MKKIIIFMALILLSSLVVADSIVGTTEKDIANCSEQLEIVLEQYNSLYADFREGVNCGFAAIQLKEMNDGLGEERDICIEELEKIKVYKIGFYIFFILLVIISIIIFFKAIKKRSQLNKENKNAR